MSMNDTATGYGWLSIFLHWFTAAVVVVLLFVGDSISTLAGVEHEDAVLLHTSVAMSAYLILWARIVLRFAYGHPGPLPKQRGVFFLLGKYTHYALLVLIAIMLVTGPLTRWFSGEGIGVWGWFVIPSPFEQDFAARDTAHLIHGWSAASILVLTLLHLVGVYKHSAFNQDGTFGKMLVPAAEERDEDKPEATPRAHAGAEENAL